MATQKKRARSGATRVRGGLPCPDCDFVARHPMGLGRHRSARHGVKPKKIRTVRPKARPPGAPWLTREQAADRAGVHYNTIRHWERRGLLRTTSRPGIRGVFVHGEDVERAAAGGTAALGARGVSIEELERRYAELVASIERLLSVAKRSGRKTVTSGRGARSGRAGTGRAKATATARRGRGTRGRSRRSA